MDNYQAYIDGLKQITIPLPPKEVKEMSEFKVNINNNTENFVKVADSEDGKSVLFSVGEAPTDNLKNNGDNLVLGCESQLPKNRYVSGVKEARERAFKVDAAIKTLEHLDYRYHGGELWEPPVTKSKDFPQAGDDSKCENIASMCDDLNRGSEILSFAFQAVENQPKETLSEVIYQGVKCKVLLGADKSGHIVILKDGNYCNPHKDDVQKPKTPEEHLYDEISSIVGNGMIENKTNGEITKLIIEKINITKKPQ